MEWLGLGPEYGLGLIFQGFWDKLVFKWVGLGPNWLGLGLVFGWGLNLPSDFNCF